MGNTFECLTILTELEFTPNILPSFSLKPSPLFLSLYAREKIPSPAFLHGHLGTGRILQGLPETFSFLGWTITLCQPVFMEEVLYPSHHPSGSPWTCSSRSVFFLCWGSQCCVQYYKWNSRMWKSSSEMVVKSLPGDSLLFNATKCSLALGCWDTQNLLYSFSAQQQALHKQRGRIWSPAGVAWAEWSGLSLGLTFSSKPACNLPPWLPEHTLSC